MSLEDLFFTMIFGVTLPVVSCMALFSFLPFKLKLRVLEKISPFWTIWFPRETAELFTEFIPYFLAWFWFLYYWVYLLNPTAPSVVFFLDLWGLTQIIYVLVRPRLIPEKPLPED